MKFKYVSLESFDGEIIGFELKQLTNVYGNSITVDTTYRSWLANGKLERKDYKLTPESLRILVYALENSKYHNKFNLVPSKRVYELYPTKADLSKHFDKIDSLPKFR